MATEKRFTFTMAKLADLAPPRDGRQYVYDAKVGGLALQVTTAGSKSFYYYRKINGKPERIRLGGFPDLKLDDARDLATQHNAKVADGVNPAELKRARKGELTLGELWELYLEFHAEAHKKASTLAEDRGIWRRYLSPWQHRKLSNIANRDVQAWHAKTGRERGKYAANRALSLLSHMMNVAKRHGVGPLLNPCEGVKRFAEKSRDRFLQPDELPRFLKALDGLDNQMLADCFRMMLWTGARKSNVLSAKWEDIDLAAGVWNVQDTKQGEPQRVPLIPEAVDVLTRRAANGKAHYVFPAPRAGTKYPYVTDVTKAWATATTAAGLPQLRMHDLRRTMGSWQALQGASLQVIGKSLGHRNASTTEIYARLTIDPVRESMQKAAAAMAATVKPPKAIDNAPEGIG